MSCYYALLKQEALLHISGPDSLHFLQGQTTCDTRNVDATHAVRGAYCTPKGRVVCDFLLCEMGQDSEDNRFSLRMRADILESSAKTFAKYIIFSKAELNSSDTHWQVFGCWGEDVKAVLATALGLEASAMQGLSTLGCIRSDGCVVIQTDGSGSEFECYINTHSHPQLAQQLAAALSMSDENTWQTLQIDKGDGRIEAATVEEFIPQMLNYDLTGHINFNKGCYTGQEVVARLHYRGTSKRRLYQANLGDIQPPSAGALLYSPESTQSVGTVVNSVRCADQSIALVVASNSGIERGLHLGAPDGSPMECRSLLPQEQSTEN